MALYEKKRLLSISLNTMFSDLKKRWKAYLQKKKEDVPPPPPQNEVPISPVAPRKIEPTPPKAPPSDGTKQRTDMAPTAKAEPRNRNPKAHLQHRSTDKHGLPRIRLNEDLSRLFDEKKTFASDTRQKITPTRKKTPKNQGESALSTEQQGRSQRDKNDIPIITETFDLYTAFSSNTPSFTPPPKKRRPKAKTSGERFSDMVDESLSGKNFTTILKEKDSLYQHGKPTSTQEKIKRYPPPETELDLHGYTGLEAKIKTGAFVENAINTGRLTLKIIVGKGLHSEGGAVLPDVVEAALIELQQEKKVLAFRWENHKKSKSGAVIVYLV